MKHLIAIIFCLFSSSFANAFQTGDMRLGLQVGQVGLQQELGERSKDAIGWGGFFNYATSDELIFELGYLTSWHDQLRHTEIPIGFNYYFEKTKPSLQFLIGMAQVSNSVSYNKESFHSTSYGAYVGLGIDIDVWKKLKSGIQAKYLKAIEQSTQLENGDRIPAVQDNYSFLLRLLYEL